MSFLTFIRNAYCRFVYITPKAIFMENTNDLIKSLSAKIDSMDSNMKKEFTSVNKRLDGIEHELRKLNTVTKYQQQYDNIPS